MSQSASSNSGVGSREVAKRVFAEEYNDATYEFKESDDDRAPSYVLLPTGDKANRVFVAGVVTEVEDVAQDPDKTYYRARVIGKTGTFRVYSGKYEPQAQSTLDQIEVPQPVTVVGKTQTFTPEEDGVEKEPIVQIRAETIDEVDMDVIEKWTVETAEATLDRIENDSSSDPYNRLVEENYTGESEDYRRTVVDALEMIHDDENHEEGEGGEKKAETQTAEEAT